MRNTEHVDQDVEDFLLEGLPRVSGKKISRSFETEGEHESLSDGEGSVVDIVFLVVSDFSSVALLHLLSRNTSIRNLSFDGEVTSSLIRDSLEEGGTSRSGTTEHETEFSGFDDAGEPFEEIPW
jgi:hypothetical protein